MITNSTNIGIGHKSDLVSYLALLFVTFIVVSFTGSIGILFFFLLISYFYFVSQNNYFWIAYFFSILSGIGGIFGKELEEIFTIGPIQVNIFILFILVSIAKVTFYKRYNNNPNFFLKPINIWLMYMLFLLVTGIFVFGLKSGGASGLRWYFFVVRLFILIPIFYFLPKLFFEHNFFEKFFSLLFYFVIINIVGQFFYIVVGKPISAIFNPSEFWASNIIDYTQKVARPTFGIWISFLTLPMAFYFLVNNSKRFSKSFLNIIIFISLLSIYITATRGWIIAISFLLVGILYVFGLFKSNFIKSLILGSFLFFSLYFLWPTFNIQVNQVYSRVATLGDIVEGDLTAEGTVSRLTTRHDAVMAHFYESPIIGLGFSSEALEANDVHTGNQTILMSGGIIGMAIILLFIYLILKTIYETHLQMKRRFFEYRNQLLIFILLFFSIIIIHSTSTAMFGYTIYVAAYGNMFFVVFILSIINRVLFDFREKIQIS